MEDASSLLERVGGWPTLVGIALVIVALVVLKQLFSKPKASAHHQTVKCPHCGWAGAVSRYKPVCPRCAKPLPGA